ncbi:hypothetical protein [Streptomyces phytohabitans]|uniref:hypothetical protein n=1 Tax=Streptomyces phytohabitans TaxID=1150371 RepID=UPI00345BF460
MTAAAVERPLFRDSRNDQVGELVGYDGKAYLLKPVPHGGREWAVPVADARQVDRSETTEETAE